MEMTLKQISHLTESSLWEHDRLRFLNMVPMQPTFKHGLLICVGIRETVDDVFKGYNGTVFAYGQTGAGKTFSMMVRFFLKAQHNRIMAVRGIWKTMSLKV